ncbi:hypothetical protein AURDEDRAFT_178784 [Auricularia subglabra TFB-10046 SS5]|uniref:HECT domain-containing protein n=1 Tax=Auricularia subglabra (strain TFB-10046 / SS5) TaxID=717982 RepID=J0WKA7_AURST|nr:hypothetical protein AURDEDRAFT_178784 [Auricularia subglabra TFB-10046 SS5]
MSFIFRLLLDDSVTPDEIDDRLSSHFGDQVVRCENVSLKSLFCVRDNIFKLGKGLGPGPERTAIAESLEALSQALSPSDLWLAQGDYRVPHMPPWRTASADELSSFRACGLAAALALIRLGHIPLLHPLFLYDLLLSKLLQLPINHPAVLDCLCDLPLIDAVDNSAYGPLSLFPSDHSTPFPPRTASTHAASLHTRLIELNFNPTTPRTPTTHRQLRQAVFCFTLFGTPLSRAQPPAEWLAFLEGFDYDVSFGNRSSLCKARALIVPRFVPQLTPALSLP